MAKGEISVCPNCGTPALAKNYGGVRAIGPFRCSQCGYYGTTLTIPKNEYGRIKFKNAKIGMSAKELEANKLIAYLTIFLIIAVVVEFIARTYHL